VDIRDVRSQHTPCKALKIILYQIFFVCFCILTPTEVETIPLHLLFWVTKRPTSCSVWSDLTGNTFRSFNRSDFITNL